MAARSMALCFSPLINGSSPSSHLKASCNSSQTQTSLSPPLIKTLSDIQSSGVIACLRAPSAELALGAARAALSGGIKVVGTILNPEDAKDAVKVGAKFLMSPAMIKDVLADVQGGDILYIPGVMTPTEILSAHNAGAKIVKVYPVSALGGVEYISALKKPFPHIPMVASQGIGIGVVEEFIARGASSVVLSDAIFGKEAIARGDFDSISQRARHVASMASEALKRLKLVQG